MTQNGMRGCASAMQQNEMEAAATIKVLEQRFSVIRNVITEKAFGAGEFLLASQKGLQDAPQASTVAARTRARGDKCKTAKRARKGGGQSKKKRHT